MQSFMVKVWKGEAPRARALLFAPLFVLSLLYRLCIDIRELLYRKSILKARAAAIPVISVGNITLGGTGKTPIVEKLSRDLKERGWNPGIVLRGYKRKKKGVFRVDGRRDTALTAGDEALMLSRKTELPVIVGNHRWEAIERGVESYGIDLVLLDDGFQVRDVKKDVELLVLKGLEKNVGRAIFPLGPCREPLKRISKADALFVRDTADSAVPAFARQIPTFAVALRPIHLYNVKHNVIAHYNLMRGKRVLAFSGLGDNNSFFDLIEGLGARLVQKVAFPDHYGYGEKDLERLASHRDVELIVTTEKDSVKLADLPIPENLFYLAVEAAIEREQELIELMLDRIKGGR